VATMISINFIFIIAVLLLTVYQTLTSRRVQVLRLVASHEVPELSLFDNKQYHTFLSHIWSSGQDQTAIIKRKLQLLLPSVKVFLDVDDLEEIGDLEKYVRASQTMVIFLSSGYFFSANCMREVDCALANGTPLILVHEQDPAKGGAPIDVLRDECRSGNRQAVFDCPRPIITWHRVADFQLLCLKMIAQGMLHCMPLFKTLEEPPEVFIPGELSLQKLEFRRAVKVYFSASNPGAVALMAEFVARYADTNVELVRRPPEILRVQEADSVRPLVAALPMMVRSPTVKLGEALGLSRAHDLTHMLLCLNRQTFVGDPGRTLAHEVKQARAYGIEVLLVHENDPGLGGCPFGHLFKTTPHDLVADGVYAKIAVACHPMPHRAVSLAQVAKAMGAVQKRSRMAKALARTTREQGGSSSRRSGSSRLSGSGIVRGVLRERGLPTISLRKVASIDGLSLSPRNRAIDICYV